MESLDSLFRHESGRIIAALTRVFGVDHLALAEDVVQDAFCRALDVWKFRGVPDNPGAWLMTTARNRALDVLRRERTARTFAPQLAQWLDSEWTLAPALDEQLAPRAVEDDLIRMMFSCCHPRLSEPAQVALVLHLLCGFSVAEVAAAFVARRAAIEKRISRAKLVLAGSERLVDVRDPAELGARLPAVQRALYLLFNQGYHGASPESAVRAELCREAIRLAELLLEHRLGARPSSQALTALLYLHAARLPTRVDEAGELASWLDQDRSKWDQGLIARGEELLAASARGPEVTSYHVEAAIAWVHATAGSTEATDWARIVRLYDRLLAQRPSPVVALNRAIAVAERDGPEQGLEAIRAIADRDRLGAYPFYPAALGQLELRCGRVIEARRHFQAALALARNPMERRFLERRVAACTG